MNQWLSWSQICSRLCSISWHPWELHSPQNTITAHWTPAKSQDSIPSPFAYRSWQPSSIIAALGYSSVTSYWFHPSCGLFRRPEFYVSCSRFKLRAFGFISCGLKRWILSIPKQTSASTLAWNLFGSMGTALSSHCPYFPNYYGTKTSVLGSAYRLVRFACFFFGSCKYRHCSWGFPQHP